MPDTLVSLVIAVAAVLPGFVTAELTQRQRAVQAGGDGQGIVLRALFYALLIHLVWSWWTWQLAQELAGPHWQRHLGETVTWALVVLVASPIAIGLPLNHVLRRAESKGSLSWWHYALSGQHSAAGQSPSEHDLFLQEMWSVDELGQAVVKLDPERGMWIAKDAIAELYFLKGDPLSG